MVWKLADEEGSHNLLPHPHPAPAGKSLTLYPVNEPPGLGTCSSASSLLTLPGAQNGKDLWKQETGPRVKMSSNFAKMDKNSNREIHVQSESPAL